MPKQNYLVYTKSQTYGLKILILCNAWNISLTEEGLMIRSQSQQLLLFNLLL